MLIEQIVSQSSLRLLALGNFSTQQILQLIAKLKLQVEIQPTEFYQIKRIDAAPAEGALNYVRRSEMEDDALVSIYLAKNQEPASLAKAELLNKLLSPAFYNQIRTQEQLTYSPFSLSFSVNDSVAFGLFTQSPAVGSAALYARFEAFLDTFKKTLATTKESEFEEIKKAHIENYLAKPNTLDSEFSYLTNEWSNKEDKIDTKLEYVALLESVTLEEVRAYYSALFFDKQQTQQILVQVKGKKFAQEQALKLPLQIEIKNIDALPKG